MSHLITNTWGNRVQAENYRRCFLIFRSYMSGLTMCTGAKMAANLRAKTQG